MIKEFYNLEEMQKYYDENTNTYIFKEDDEYIDLVVFNFSLGIKADIDCWNINAQNIKAWDIKANNISACNINSNNINASDINALDINANDIKAWDINVTYINASNIDARNINATDIDANDITYYAICFAYKNIKCKSIKGRRKNSKHFVLDGKLEIENEKL